MQLRIGQFLRVINNHNHTTAVGAGLLQVVAQVSVGLQAIALAGFCTVFVTSDSAQQQIAQ